MPLTSEIDHAARRIRTVGSGTVTAAELRDHVERTVAAQALVYDELLDLRGVGLEITAADVSGLAALVMRHAVAQPPGRTAMVASEDVIYGLGRMYASLAEPLDPMFTVFRDMDEALAFLNDPYPPRIS